MKKTKIEWADMTWNPITGCQHGCEYCYARRIVKRFVRDEDAEVNSRPFKRINKYDVNSPIDLDTPLYKTPDCKRRIPFPFGFIPTLYRYKLDETQRVKKPQNIFVCSMADLFGDWIPDEWIKVVLGACATAPWHRYLFLTKNPYRYFPVIEYLENDDFELPKEANENFQMWFGATATNENQLYEANDSPANWLCIEPLAEDISGAFEECVVLTKIWDMSGSIRDYPRWTWIIVGAETGNRKGKVVPKREWIEEIVKGCQETETPLFMKNSLAKIWGEPLIQEYPDWLLMKG